MIIREPDLVGGLGIDLILCMAMIKSGLLGLLMVVRKNDKWRMRSESLKWVQVQAMYH